MRLSFHEIATVAHGLSVVHPYNKRFIFISDSPLYKRVSNYRLESILNILTVFLLIHSFISVSLLCLLALCCLILWYVLCCVVFCCVTVYSLCAYVRRDE